MIDAVVHKLELDYPKDSLDGQTERVVAIKALENPKLKPKMRTELENKLMPPDIPDGYEILWEAFWDLFSGERLSYFDIYAYGQLYGIRFTETELNSLRIMDNVGCKFVADETKKRAKTPKKGT